MADLYSTQDPAQTGTGGLKGLPGLNKREFAPITPATKAYADDYVGAANRALLEGSPRENIGVVGLNDSSFDSLITSATLIDNLNNTRGELQPWYLLVGAGLAKGTVLAGTTFADGIIGTVVGLGNAAITGTFEGFWNNPFSLAMQGINEWSEELLPNYYTDAELNDPWYTNIFTGNFIGDKFIKNLGFAVGAAYSGRVNAGVVSRIAGLNKARQAFLGAVTASGLAIPPSQLTQSILEGNAFIDGIKLTTSLANEAKKLKYAEPALKLTGAISGALGEARIEAIQTSKDWADLHLELLTDYQLNIRSELEYELFNSRPDLFQSYRDLDGSIKYQISEFGLELLEEELNNRFDFDGGMSKIAEDLAKVGNVTFLLNLPLLTVSDAWQFGKFYAGGFNSARKANTITKRTLTDGTIEYVGSSPTLLLKAGKLSSKAIAEGPYEEMGLATASTLAGYKYSSELNDFFGAKINPDTERETIGWLKATAQALADTYGTVEGWEEGFIGGMTGLLGIPGFRSTKTSAGKFQSPIYLEGGIKEDYQELNESKERTNAIVKALNDRVLSPQFLNYYLGAIRHNKFQNDMDVASQTNNNFEFKNAEHSLLVSDAIMFNEAGRIQDLYDIIESAGNLSIDLVEGLRLLTTNKESGKSIYDDMTDQEVVEFVKRLADEAKTQVDQYREIADNLSVKVGDVFNKGELEELTWMVSKIGNWELRFESLANETRNSIVTIARTLNEILPDSKYTNAVLDLLSETRLSPLSLLLNLSENNTLIAQLHLTRKAIESQYEGIDKIDIIQNVNDMIQLANARTEFIKKYEGYLNNPLLLRENLKKKADQVAELEITLLNQEATRLLKASTNMQLFKENLNQIEDEELAGKVLKSLLKEGNQLAIDYNDLKTYDALLREYLASNSNNETFSDVNTMIDSAYQEASNVDQYGNPLNVNYNSPELIYDDTITPELNNLRYQRAHLLMLNALSTVNQSKEFRDRFKGPNVNPAPLATTSNALISLLVSPTLTPTGDINNETLVNENKELSEYIVSPIPESTGLRLYYRPAIPLIHLEASKEGDFRPFNLVAKEKDKNVNFGNLYNYLDSNGTFTYLNEGNLSASDEVGFMIDPDFNDHTIFLVKPLPDGSHLIIGSLDESDYSVLRFEGLLELLKQIRDEFNSREGEGRFIATPTTRVAKIMVGKIPYSSETHNLSDIPGVDKNSKFGIIKNGAMTTNDKISDDKVSKPSDISNKEGRLYLLIEGADGTYKPAAVRVAHFNSSEFNLNDLTSASTPIGKSLNNTFDKLAKVQNNDDVTALLEELGSDLYIGNLHINYENTASGDAIIISRPVLDQNGNQVFEERNGQLIQKRDSKIVFLTEKALPIELGGIVWSPEAQAALGVTVNLGQAIPVETIKSNLITAFLELNQPMQVSARRLNTPAYTNYILNSNILSSNLLSASTVGNWFITDYFDVLGNILKAIKPALTNPQPQKKVETPVGGTNGVILGLKVNIGNLEYTVDKNNNVYSRLGQLVNPEKLGLLHKIILDEAYLSRTYGDLMDVPGVMIEGLAVLPDGTGYDRIKLNGIYGQPLTKLKEKLSSQTLGAGVNNVEGLNQVSLLVSKSNITISKILESLLKVDKNRTDSQSYYILEEDGEYHAYDRVHTRLGNNWILSEELDNSIKDVNRLINKVNTLQEWKLLLLKFEKEFSLDLSVYYNNLSPNNIDIVLSILRDKITGTKGRRALEAGTSVDAVIRDFFSENSSPLKPPNLSEEAYNSLLTDLTNLKDAIEARGEKFITNNVVLYFKYPDGTRVAGEVDILSIDKDGNFNIYDVKTSRYSFYNGESLSSFMLSAGDRLRMSTLLYYTNQLSAYKNLFESQFGTPIKSLGILPFVISYDNLDNVSTLYRLKGIKIKYSPNTPVPTVREVKLPQNNSKVSDSLPIFSASNEILVLLGNNRILEVDKINDNSKIGYYQVEGKVYNGYLNHEGTINGEDIYISRHSVMSEGKNGPFVAALHFYVVFKNGNALNLILDTTLKTDYNTIVGRILSKLEGNPNRVVLMASVDTLIGKVPVEPQLTTIEAQKIPPSSINTVATLNSLKPLGKRRPPKPRLVDRLREVGDINQELDWLSQVLPLVQRNDLIHIHKGLINVAELGSQAWGLFNDGIITLSDVAAPGTLYHEAFHFVFNTMLDSSELNYMLDLIKKVHGNKPILELEELMAEHFREYVTDLLSMRSWSSKFTNFFKDIYYKVRNWLNLKPSLTEFYWRVNNGRYARGESNNQTDIRSITNSVNLLQNQNEVINFAGLDSNTKDNLLRRGFSLLVWNSMTRQELDHAIKCSSL